VSTSERTYIFAGMAWQHEAGPYSRRRNEITIAGNVSAFDYDSTYRRAVVFMRQRYPREQGWSVGVDDVRGLWASGIALPPLPPDVCPASAAWASEVAA